MLICLGAGTVPCTPSVALSLWHAGLSSSSGLVVACDRAPALGRYAMHIFDTRSRALRLAAPTLPESPGLSVAFPAGSLSATQQRPSLNGWVQRQCRALRWCRLCPSVWFSTATAARCSFHRSTLRYVHRVTVAAASLVERSPRRIFERHLGIRCIKHLPMQMVQASSLLQRDTAEVLPPGCRQVSATHQCSKVPHYNLGLQRYC